jgi:hypothetical protein
LEYHHPGGLTKSLIHYADSLPSPYHTLEYPLGYLLSVYGSLYYNTGTTWELILSSNTSIGLGLYGLNGLVYGQPTSQSIQVTSLGVGIDPEYYGQPSITTVGTITEGTWNATLFLVPYGGTSQTYLQPNNILIGEGTNPVQDTRDAPVGDFVGTTDIQTLGNKTLVSPILAGTLKASSSAKLGNCTSKFGDLYAITSSSENVGIRLCAVDTTTQGIQFSNDIDRKKLVLYSEADDE